MPALRNTHVGDRVRIDGLITRHQNGQTFIRLPGVGKSGEWQLPGSVVVDVVSSTDSEIRTLRAQVVDLGGDPDYG